MPIDVRPEERLAQIAAATLRVVEQRGAAGVTIRAVAAEMGGSTTVVTNYIPSRSRLIANAIEHALRRWRVEMVEQLEGVAPEHELRELARWSGGTTGDDPAVRHLFVELLAGANPGQELDALRADSDEHREHMRTAAAAAGLARPELAADLIHLVLRGFYLAALEDADVWTADRVEPLIEYLVDLLEGASR